MGAEGTCYRKKGRRGGNVRKEQENGTKRQSRRLCLFVGLLTSRWISNTRGFWRWPSRSKARTSLQVIQMGRKKATRRAGRAGRREEKLVVKRDIGCDGLWGRRGRASRLYEIGGEGGGEEKESGVVGVGEAPSTTPSSCSLAVWAEGRMEGKFSTTWVRRCDVLWPAIKAIRRPKYLVTLLKLVVPLH